jgi:IS5 family transposase
MQEIERMSPKQRHDQQTAKYRELIRIAEQVIENARQVLKRTRKARGKSLMEEIAIGAIRKEIDRYCGLGDRVVDQARRRALEGEQVPNNEKIFSIFETHTDLIIRGKIQKPVEFGHKVLLAEGAHGLITQYQVLDGNPSDENHVEASLERHKEMFGHAPELYASDRGFFNKKNVEACEQADVVIVCIPQRGGKKTPEREAFEKSPDFKKGQRFRAGIEGRISVLFRGRGMKRARVEGREHFEVLVGAAVLANNLLVIANLLLKKQQKQQRRAA